MPTITVRVTDEVRDGLQKLAEAERITLSDYVRNTLQNSIHQANERERKPEHDGPTSLTRMERHAFSLLHRILGRVLPPDANDVDGDAEYQLRLAKVLEQGFTAEYWTEFSGLRPELSRYDSEFVADTLDMFRALQGSLDALEEAGINVDEDLKRRLKFSGFDRNDPLESQMADYVRFLVEDERWEEQAAFVLGREKGNSHMRMISTYSRMLTEYREIRQAKPRAFTRESYLLTEPELRRMEHASLHPDMH